MGDAIELAAGDYRADIGRRGAAMCRLSFGGEELIWRCPPDEPPPASHGLLLAPWPNRIRDGRYTFKGVEHQLEVTEPRRGTALHGLAYSRPWLPVEIASDRARLTCLLDGAAGYPYSLELAADYELDAAGGLSVTVAARNTGDSPAPYGMGSHPFLSVDTMEDAVLELPASRRLPVDERLLPAGAPEPVEGTEHDFRTPRPIGAAAFDTAFTDLKRDADGLAWTVLTSGGTSTGVWADSSCGWLQVFSAEGLPGGLNRRGLAVEPMTCPPDAFNSGTDVTVLEPGEETRSRFGVMRLSRP
ncbi:aldose 1-epimerase family protein [Streptomonospora salina]|uniref:Aldose 1-epimerase n=1 Tax=Streptomonospora salina TaxID=104205 RepID=A0A841E6K9_9ACTN|nr:aldose 1-epimerase family protein [Streptomonospora salina]MBB5996773.1 aldose 1-epimerase [Streptomonospora salina]